MIYFEQLSFEPLHEQAYSALRNALSMGRLMPGQSVTIRGLGASLGISATPVREALQRLIADGALELAPNRTIRVPVMTRNRFTEITEIRVRLECLAAEMAAQSVDHAVLAQLQSLSDRMHVSISEERFSDYLSHNQSFHFAIYEAAALPCLLHHIGLCWLRTGPWLNKLASEGRFHSIANGEHETMIAALRLRDAAALSKSLERDIRDAGAVLIDQLEAAPTPKELHGAAT